MGPRAAVEAGFLDQVVEIDKVEETAIAVAKKLGEMPSDAYARMKRDIRGPALKAMAAGF